MRLHWYSMSHIGVERSAFVAQCEGWRSRYRAFSHFIRDEGEVRTAAVLCYTEGAHQHHHLPRRDFCECVRVSESLRVWCVFIPYIDLGVWDVLLLCWFVGLFRFVSIWVLGGGRYLCVLVFVGL